MPKSIQEHLAAVIEQSAAELISAAQEVPEDKLDWKPFDKGRTVIDQMAECAVLNGYTATILTEGKWEANSFNNYEQDRQAAGTTLESLSKAVNDSIPSVVAAVRALSDEQLDVEIATPFGPMCWERIATYPYWNMSYHTGQVTYIATMSASD